jgi:hypothetical protein
MMYKEYVDKREKLSRKTRWEQLDDDVQYNSKDLDWRGRFPKGPFLPVSRSSGDRYQRSSKGPLRFGHGIALAIVGFERANATPIFFE